MITLGIDLGTTTTKVVVLNTGSGRCEVLYEHSENNRANSRSKESKYSEQDVSKICSSLEACMDALTSQTHPDTMSSIECITVCGQMHGCMLWNNTETNADSVFVSDTSSLITWKDQRCTVPFLKSLPFPINSVPPSTGYGCSTLFWLAQNDPQIIKKYHFAGTIMDYIVFRLCRLSSPVMSTQNAMSWGYYNFNTAQWNTDILRDVDFPIGLLPTIVEAGNKAGTLCLNWYGIPAGISILAALGDMQCSFLSCTPKPTDLVFYLGTSAQLSKLGLLSEIINERLSASDACRTLPQPMVYVPFFRSYCLLTAASLNGGDVFQSFIDMLFEWTVKFQPTVTKEDIYSKFIHLELENTTDTSIQIQPTIHGERHDPNSLGAVVNISPTDLSLDKVTCQLARGIVRNVVDMFKSGIDTKNVTRIWACGNVFKKNPLFQQALRREFTYAEVKFDKTMDAAYGAALVLSMLDSLTSSKNELICSATM